MGNQDIDTAPKFLYKPYTLGHFKYLLHKTTNTGMHLMCCNIAMIATCVGLSLGAGLGLGVAIMSGLLGAGLLTMALS